MMELKRIFYKYNNLKNYQKSYKINCGCNVFAKSSKTLPRILYTPIKAKAKFRLVCKYNYCLFFLLSTYSSNNKLFLLQNSLVIKSL